MLVKKLVDQFVDEVSALGSLPMYTIVLLVFLLLKDFETVVILIIAVLLSFLIAAIIRIGFFKTRPENKDKKAPRNMLERIEASSFPSVHSSRAGILAYVIYSLSIPLGGIIAVLYLIMIMGARIYLKKHDFVDVLAGALIGLFIGVVCFRFF